MKKPLSIDEEEGKADPSPYPLPQGEREHNSHERKRCPHHEFAEQHQFSFGWRARQLAPDDPALQDDLVQEMSLAVLEYGEAASSEFLLELANNRAIDYLRYEAARGKMSLKGAARERFIRGEDGEPECVHRQPEGARRSNGVDRRGDRNAAGSGVRKIEWVARPIGQGRAATRSLFT